MKKDFYFPSQDGVTQIHGIEWKPDGEVKGILQICHGMVEHIERYHDFAMFLCEHGYYVVGHDHLGHGKSIVSKDKLGYFQKDKGNACVIGDIHTLRQKTEKDYPGVPYFMLGHSMGSFLVRQYIGMHGAGLSGAVVMGTGEQPSVILGAGKFVCKMIAACKGWEHRSTLVDGMALGANQKAYAHVTDGSSWLTRNPEIVKQYKEDPQCGFRFTLNAYYFMFSGMEQMNKQEKAQTLPKTLPVFFVAGAKDPVGSMGKGVQNVYEIYKRMGMKDVEIKLYEEDRHEILNELDKDVVYQDILNWLESRK